MLQLQYIDFRYDNKEETKWREKTRRVGIAEIIRLITRKGCVNLISWTTAYVASKKKLWINTVNVNFGEIIIRYGLGERILRRKN